MDTNIRIFETENDTTYIKLYKIIKHKSGLTSVYIILGNYTNEDNGFYGRDFAITDSEGFTYQPKEDIGDENIDEANYVTGYYFVIPRKTKFRYVAFFENVKDVHSVSFLGRGSLEYIRLQLSEEYTLFDKRNKNENACLEINKIKELECKIKELEDENYNLMMKARESTSYKSVLSRRNEELLIKYEIIEDDDYFRIISSEESDTVAFYREFDKSKENHNWINVGDPLVSLVAENTPPVMSARTIVKSPVSGIFEFNSNKLIGFGDEICRVRKYLQEERANVIMEIEKEEIREAVFKKERKKMLEREALDELIEDGLVFNVYTKKEGNRTTVPMDIATAVWNRDGGKCCMCGQNKELEFDHIIPLSKGGATSFRNLQLLCKNCNRSKSDKI